MKVERQLIILKCVADETRLKILHELGKGERSVRDIMNGLDKEQSLVSHHLQEMRKCGLVVRRRDGKNIMYRLPDKSIINFLEDADKLSKKFCLGC